MSDIEQRIAALEGRVDVLEDRAASQIDFPDEEETESVVTYSLHEYYVNTWVDRPIPFTGTRVINKTYFSDAAYVTLGQFKITAIDGDLEFETDAFEETGIAAPFVDYHGKFASGVIPQGQHMILRLRSKLTGGARIFPHYTVTVNGRPVIDLTVRFSSQLRRRI
jgi:hypothetical protein